MRGVWSLIPVLVLGENMFFGQSADPPPNSICLDDVRFIINTNPETFLDADGACSPGRLARIRSSQEYQVVIDLVNSINFNQDFWLGMTTDKIGDTTKVNVIFTDGSSDGLDFVNTGFSFPWVNQLALFIEEQGAVWQTSDNRWDMINRGGLKKPFLCRDICTTESPTQVPTVSPTKSPSKSPTESPIPFPTTSPTFLPTRSPGIPGNSVSSDYPFPIEAYGGLAFVLLMSLLIAFMALLRAKNKIRLIQEENVRRNQLIIDSAASQNELTTADSKRITRTPLESNQTNPPLQSSKDLAHGNSNRTTNTPFQSSATANAVDVETGKEKGNSERIKLDEEATAVTWSNLLQRKSSSKLNPPSDDNSDIEV